MAESAAASGARARTKGGKRKDWTEDFASLSIFGEQRQSARQNAAANGLRGWILSTVKRHVANLKKGQGGSALRAHRRPWRKFPRLVRGVEKADCGDFAIWKHVEKADRGFSEKAIRKHVEKADRGLSVASIRKARNVSRIRQVDRKACASWCRGGQVATRHGVAV